MRIRDVKNSDPRSRMEKIRVWDKHPGSATLTQKVRNVLWELWHEEEWWVEDSLLEEWDGGEEAGEQVHARHHLDARHLVLLKGQCSFLYGSGSVDPYHWVTHPDLAKPNLLKSRKTVEIKVFLCFNVLRIRNVYPGSWFLPIPDLESRISDPGSKNSNNERGEKKLAVITFYVATNFTKLQIWANFFKEF